MLPASTCGACGVTRKSLKDLSPAQGLAVKMFSTFPKVESGIFAAGMLQPLDIVLCLKLASIDREFPGYEHLAFELDIALSSAHRSVKRLQHAGLLTAARRPQRAAVLELLIHGVRYVYYAKPGELTRGIPTAHAALPLSELIAADTNAVKPVWPDPKGNVRGYAVTPLHKNVPTAALRDAKLYELLALVDAVRIGRARERAIAEDELRKRLLP